MGACIQEREYHFHRQLLKRYGIVLGVGQFTRVKKDIERSRTHLIKARGDGAGIYAVQIDGNP